ncbi:MAG TPA: hypothetical protein VID75_13400, partial [Acidimicrobiales bacterium]
MAEERGPNPGDDRELDPTSRLLGNFVRQVSAEVLTPAWTAPTDMPAGRDRDGRRPGHPRGRRVLAATLATVAVAGAVAVVVAYGPRSRDAESPVSGHPAAHGTSVTVRSVRFGGTFRPSEEVGAGGALWLIGQKGPVSDSSGCQIGRLDPASLSMTMYPLSACGMNVAAGDGRLYLETARSQPDNSYLIQIETFSLSDHSSTVFAPVVMTVFGSEIAHTQLAYVDGNLWLYGYTNKAEVVRISPATGGVDDTFTIGVPEIGGTEPLISAGPDGVWLAGGAGGSAALARFSDFPTALEWTLAPLPATTLTSAPDSTTVEWLATVAGRLWVGEASSSSSPSPRSPLVERITVLESADTFSRRVVVTGPVRVVKRSPAEEYGLAPVTVGNEVLSVGPGQTCRSQPIWKVDPSTLRTSVVTTLHPPF